jgi:hypothetical protein
LAEFFEQYGIPELEQAHNQHDCIVVTAPTSSSRQDDGTPIQTPKADLPKESMALKVNRRSRLNASCDSSLWHMGAVPDVLFVESRANAIH